MGDEKSPQYYFNIREDLIRLIPLQAKNILEVGCAAGMTGKALKERGLAEIVGIEVNKEVAQKAQSYYDKLIVGDVEKIKLPFKKTHFDCILYGDVLEHLVDPWKLLEEHKILLKKGGIIICSIPNVRHYRVIKKLIFQGEWEYAASGIMDRAHLRFFTLNSIRRMLKEAGFEIKEIKGLIRRPNSFHWLKLLNRLFWNRLRDFLVRQYIVVAVKKEEIKEWQASM